MKRSIEKIRSEYQDAPLVELKPDPIVQFQLWLEEACRAEVMEPNGMTLSTLSEGGRPTARTVLLKKVDRKGFVFFTHYGSRKGRHLERHHFGALTFWWRELYRQVCVEGNIERTPRKESLLYFKKRPRGAQLAALASDQSEPLLSRADLEESFARLKRDYRGKEIPCPKNWGGYRLVPERVEFWKGQKNRLHDRFVYVKTKSDWLFTRLYP